MGKTHGVTRITRVTNCKFTHESGLPLVVELFCRDDFPRSAILLHGSLCFRQSRLILLKSSVVLQSSFLIDAPGTPFFFLSSFRPFSFRYLSNFCPVFPACLFHCFSISHKQVLNVWVVLLCFASRSHETHETLTLHASVQALSTSSKGFWERSNAQILLPSQRSALKQRNQECGESIVKHQALWRPQSNLAHLSIGVGTATLGIPMPCSWRWNYLECTHFDTRSLIGFLEAKLSVYGSLGFFGSISTGLWFGAKAMLLLTFLPSSCCNFIKTHVITINWGQWAVPALAYSWQFNLCAIWINLVCYKLQLGFGNSNLIVSRFQTTIHFDLNL